MQSGPSERLIILVSVCLVGYFDLSAQTFTNLAVLEYQNHAPTKVKGQSDEKRSLDKLKFNALVPIKIGNGSYLLGGAHFVYHRFALKRESVDPVISKFKTYGARFGLQYQWKKDPHSTFLLLLPQWSGDSPSFRNEAFQLGGVILHTYRLNPKLALKVGLYYNREFFGNFFMPLAGLEWQIRNNITLYGTLPGSLSCMYDLNKTWSFSLNYWSPNGSLLEGGDGRYIRIGKVWPPHSEFCAQIHWRIRDPFVIQCDIGHTLWRHYGEYTQDKVQITDGYYPDYRDGLLFKIAAILRVYEQ